MQSARGRGADPSRLAFIRDFRHTVYSFLYRAQFPARIAKGLKVTNELTKSPWMPAMERRYAAQVKICAPNTLTCDRGRLCKTQVGCHGKLMLGYRYVIGDASSWSRIAGAVTTMLVSEISIAFQLLQLGRWRGCHRRVRQLCCVAFLGRGINGSGIHCVLVPVAY